MHPSLNVHSYHCQGKRHRYKNIQEEVHCSIHEEAYCSQCHNHEGIPYTAYFATNVGYIYFDPTYFICRSCV